MSDKHIELIKEAIEPLREQIINHKIYAAIKDIDDLKIFMQHHVFAVWDFMSLLKALQNNLTCTSVPWFPPELNDACYLINEIVVGEESDVDEAGDRKSHFGLYLDAMQQCGANTRPINDFIEELKGSRNFTAAYDLVHAPQSVRNFVDYTFGVINSGKAHLQAAVFTFGREDLIPEMFVSMVKDIHAQLPGSVSVFKYYLERHIKVDGDNHSPLALQMTSSLCGKNEQFWKEALPAVEKALQKRIELWDGAYNQIMSRKEKGVVL